MKRETALRLLREELPRLQSRYGVRSLRLVGSTARDAAKHDSDVDVLVDFHEIPSLVILARVKSDLEARLGIKVDVLMESGLRPRTRSQALMDAVQV